MFFNGKNIRDVTESDLLTLIGTGREGRSIDFKSAVYTPIFDADLEGKSQGEKDKLKNKWKLDFRTDLTSFANTNGGWIICGMKEENGVATEVSGLGEDFNGDATIRRLTDCAKTGIEPPIDGVIYHEIDLKEQEKSKILIIQIPRSYRSPHRVTETSKFNVRRDRGNAEMNIDELRTAFNLSVSLVDRIKEFRYRRVEALIQNDAEEIPLNLSSGVKCALHVLPLSFTDPGTKLSFTSFEFVNKGFDKSGNWHLGNNTSHNLDGVVIPIGQNKKTDDVKEYIQVFRTGAVESVFTPNFKDGAILLGSVESFTLEYLGYSLGFLTALNVLPPITVMLSVINVKDLKLTPGLTAVRMLDDVSLPLRQNKILLPDIVINNYEENSDDVMKPIFDVLWNSGGWKACLNYDRNGKRIPFDR